MNSTNLLIWYVKMCVLLETWTLSWCVRDIVYYLFLVCSRCPCLLKTVYNVSIKSGIDNQWQDKPLLLALGPARVDREERHVHLISGTVHPLPLAVHSPLPSLSHTQTASLYSLLPTHSKFLYLWEFPISRHQPRVAAVTSELGPKRARLCWKMIWNSARFVPIWGQSDLIGTKSDIPD